MFIPIIKNCPGTLAANYNTYSRTCLNRVFNGNKISHILPYDSPITNKTANDLFEENTLHMSISGVQEKFSMIQVKNKLKLTGKHEMGTHILKPIPSIAKNADQMPANEHLTMQIARQVYGIETAENAIIFLIMASRPILLNVLIIETTAVKVGKMILPLWPEKPHNSKVRTINTKEII